jgi:hypothetical protein
MDDKFKLDVAGRLSRLEERAERIPHIESKMDQLLEFKWKMIGEIKAHGKIYGAISGGVIALIAAIIEYWVRK